MCTTLYFDLHIRYSTLLLLSHFSRVRLCATPWTAAHQAPPSMGFSRQQYWSAVPLPSPMLQHPYHQMFSFHLLP